MENLKGKQERDVMDFWKKQQQGARRRAELHLQREILRVTAPVYEEPGFDPAKLDLAGWCKEQEGQV